MTSSSPPPDEGGAAPADEPDAARPGAGRSGTTGTTGTDAPGDHARDDQQRTTAGEADRDHPLRSGRETSPPPAPVMAPPGPSRERAPDRPGDADAGSPGPGDPDHPDHEPAVEPVTTTAEGVTADLWAFRFTDPVMAQEALLAALRLQRRKRLELDDAAIVVRDERGRTRIIQTKDISTGQGALSGSWLGLLAGLFVPGGPLVGMALGAAAGGLFAKLRDKGINDDEMKQWGEQLANGESALFLLVEDCHQMRALHEVSRFPATVLTSTAPADLVEDVRARLAVDPWGP